MTPVDIKNDREKKKNTDTYDALIFIVRGRQSDIILKLLYQKLFAVAIKDLFFFYFVSCRQKDIASQ